MNANHDWRPDRFDSFVGQRPIVAQLRCEVASARKSNRAIRHVLASGPGGLGKNTLVSILAAERGSPPPTMLMGSTLTHESLSKVLLSQESPGYNNRGNLVDPTKARFPIVCIDECQKMSRDLLELLHPVLEPVDPEGRPIFIAKVPDPNQRNKLVTAPLWMVNTTICFLTNFAGEFETVSPATVTRIPLKLTFEWYEDDDMCLVVKSHAEQLKVKITEAAAILLAQRSNGMPRQAVHLLKRAVDFLDLAENKGALTAEIVREMLTVIGIDDNGLDRQMIKYLKVLVQSGSGKLGLQAIASIMGVDKATITTAIEPILMRRGLVYRETGGRMITGAGRNIIEGTTPSTSPLSTRSV